MTRLELYNAATIRAPRRLFDPKGSWRSDALKVRWGFMELPQWGVTLIDTGYGPQCYGPASGRLNERGKSLSLLLYTTVFRAQLREEGQVQTVLAQKGLGLSDVETVLVTHLHADHVSELRALPKARFIGSRAALKAVQAAGWKAPMAHGSFPELLPDDYEDRLHPLETLPEGPLPYGLGTGRVLVPGAVSLVPLEGHAVGHFGVLLHDSQTLYAVDAHWILDGLQHGSTLSGLPRQIAVDVAAAEATMHRLRAFKQAGGRVLLCHEPEDTPLDVL